MSDDIVVISLPEKGGTRPFKVCADRNLVVNRADAGDRNVVISFDTPVTSRGSFGPGEWWEKTVMRRDAIGFSPRQARLMAAALIRAAEEVES